MPALLEAEDLTAQYGWTKVLHGLAFAVESGGILPSSRPADCTIP